MAVNFKKTKKKPTWQSFFFSFVLGLLTLGLILFLSVSNWKINEKRKVVAEEISRFQDEIAILEEQRDAYKAGIDQAATEGFQEEKIREQGYKKPGEEVIAVLKNHGEEEEENGQLQMQQSQENFIESFFQKIKDLETEILIR